MKSKTGIVLSSLIGVLILGAIACSSSPASQVTATPAPTPPPKPEWVNVTAPVESVAIELGVGSPNEAELVVVSALPDNCHRFEGLTLKRDGEVTRVEVTNSKRSDPNLACTEVYRTVTTRAPLGGGFEACETYTVVVNGETQRVQAIDSAVKCENPDQPASGRQDKVPSLAPIDGVEIEVSESAPPQYFAVVTSGLPNGCAEFDRYIVERLGDTIWIGVTNLVPADEGTICTQVYGTVESSIPLGTDFEPGKTYIVRVNDVSEKFIAQGSPPALDAPFQVKFKQTASIASQGLGVEFVDVLQDSRCPADVVCVWAGQAVVLVAVTSDGEDLGRHEFTLEGGAEDSEGKTVGQYSVKLTALDPYPDTAGASNPLDESDYIATLVVARGASSAASTPTPSPVKEWKLEGIQIDDSTLRVVLSVFAGIDVRVTLDGSAATEVVTDRLPVIEYVFQDVAPGRHTVVVRDVVGYEQTAEVVVP